jgi:hypothetical protein
MISFAEHKSIDKRKWDACVNASPNDNIFVQSWYLDIVCENWCALILNDYDAVFPMAPGLKYKINYLHQPFFSRYFGSYKKNSVLVSAGDFFNAIPEKFKFLEFCIHEQNEFNNKEYQVKECKYQLLDLGQKYASLYSAYSDNTKRNIKKAIKKKYSIREGIRGREVVALFKETKGAELEVFKPKDYAVLINIMEASQKKEAKSYAVYDEEGKLAAAAFFMKYKDRYIFLKSGVTEQGKTYGAMHFLIDTFIREHAEQHKMLDFGGSSVESVARFYKSFGAKDCLYLRVKRSRLPGLINWIKSLKK